jgi:pilus assembly protein Flp/PilA
MYKGEIMPAQLANFCLVIGAMLEDDNGQDLIEYALVVALIAFAAISGMGSLAAAINTAFSNIGATLNSNV